jgi:hypothetical protein
LVYQPPGSSTFLSEQTSHQQPTSSTFLSEQINTSHQPNEQAGRLVIMVLLPYEISIFDQIELYL